MDKTNVARIGEMLARNSYPGRGIVAGKSADGKSAAIAYFIMGRSENSRNRVFVPDGDDLVIHPHDPSKVSDPSLIIYSPVRNYKNFVIVTNGDQTDTIYEGLSSGKSFEDSLKTRTFEPDFPNFTPRISALLEFGDSGFTYKMSILKSADDVGSACNRFTFDYSPLPGVGHFLHTYEKNGAPLPSFTGEPRSIAIPDTADGLFGEILENLDKKNGISLFVRYISLSDGRKTTRIYNKNEVRK